MSVLQLCNMTRECILFSSNLYVLRVYLFSIRCTLA